MVTTTLRVVVKSKLHQITFVDRCGKCQAFVFGLLFDVLSDFFKV